MLGRGIEVLGLNKPIYLYALRGELIAHDKIFPRMSRRMIGGQFTF